MSESGGKQTVSKSIMQNEQECYICKTTQGLHLHHVFNGTANRKKADQDGCVVWLCYRHHELVHTDQKLDNIIKAKTEKQWLKTYNKTEEDFIKRYGKNYL